MKRVTTWSPDTCGCVIEYQYDDAIIPIAITYKNVVKRCPSHSALSGISLYNQVLSENTRKNYTFAEIQQIFPGVEYENYNWSFDKGKLKFGLLGVAVTPAQRALLQANCNARFGAGNVEVI